MGYTVLDASNAHDALAIAARDNGEIDLLLTDLVMPGMRGTDLAREVVASHPRIRVLMMSGYSEESSNDKWTLPPNVTLLEKPFSATSLARKVRDVLSR
jgi:DNA-binding NtrC family response regulator